VRLLLILVFAAALLVLAAITSTHVYPPGGEYEPLCAMVSVPVTAFVLAAVGCSRFCIFVYGSLGAVVFTIGYLSNRHDWDESLPWTLRICLVACLLCVDVAIGFGCSLLGVGNGKSKKRLDIGVDR